MPLRKRTKLADEPRWLDVERLATIECSSEDPDHPVRSIVSAGATNWRAGEPSEQTILLEFAAPLALRRVRLVFEERARARTQEFLLSWSGDGGQTYREVVRQQYNFSPPGTIREVEDYEVNLDGVTALELTIVPDVSGGDARASLARLQLA